MATITEAQHIVTLAYWLTGARPHSGPITTEQVQAAMEYLLPRASKALQGAGVDADRFAQLWPSAGSVAGRLATAEKALQPCPPPAVWDGYDACGHDEETWPCARTRVAWRVRGLDVDLQRHRVLMAAQEEFFAGCCKTCVLQTPPAELEANNGECASCVGKAARAEAAG
jgi:hypothetical protein